MKISENAWWDPVNILKGRDQRKWRGLVKVTNFG
jgi:hypothetical protein